MCGNSSCVFTSAVSYHMTRPLYWTVTTIHHTCPGHSHLRCDVVWGATEGACGPAFVHVLLAHAKVSDLDVALGVQHHVVELQVPAAQRGFCRHGHLLCAAVAALLPTDPSLSSLSVCIRHHQMPFMPPLWFAALKSSVSRFFNPPLPIHYFWQLLPSYRVVPGCQTRGPKDTKSGRECRR